MSAETAEIGYDVDFFEWTQRQAELLRREAELRSNAPLDWRNLAEEIESVGLRDRREVASRASTILEHLLKLQISAAVDPKDGWRATIRRDRDELADIFEQSPSLRRTVAPALKRTWARTRRRVTEAIGHEVDERRVPRDLPFTAKQILDPDFWPPRERDP